MADRSKFKDIHEKNAIFKADTFYSVIFVFQIKNNIMKDLIEKIEATYESFKTDANTQLEDGNKSAGTRARKSSLELEKLLKEFRKVSIAESKK